MSGIMGGEQLQEIWASCLVDQGLKVSRWHELSATTQKAWQHLALKLATQIMQLSENFEDSINENKISWMLSHLNHKEKQKTYQLLFNMNYRINR